VVHLRTLPDDATEKDFERSSCVLIEMLPGMCLEGMREATRNRSKLSVSQSQFGSRHLPDMSLQPHCCTKAKTRRNQALLKWQSLTPTTFCRTVLCKTMHEGNLFRSVRSFPKKLLLCVHRST